MRTLGRTCWASGLLAIGYLLGTSQTLSLQSLLAQAEATGPSAETSDKVKAARDAADSAMLALQQEKFYVPAIVGLNSFAATSGGIDAIADLQSGRGVDPETFAGLYAGLAVDQIAPDISKDDKGRLTYKDKVIRMYPVSRIKQLFQSRVAKTADGQPAGIKPADIKPAEKSKKAAGT
ncbi:MAG: hypothetical protein WD648_15910 [Planctomycetaceae bacterium]